MTEEKESRALIKGRSETAIALAGKAIKHARLRKTPGVDGETRIMNLAKVLMATHPRSEHGQLLVRALQPGTGYRSPEEIAVRFLVRQGMTPTIPAVAGYVRALAAREAKDTERTSAASQIAGSDGLRAAQFVADRIRDTGEAPTWLDLAINLGWPRNNIVYAKVIKQLERDGWITTGREPRSLRPGSRYECSCDRQTGYPHHPWCQIAREAMSRLAGSG